MRPALVATCTGALLAIAALIAVSCQSPSRLVPVDARARERAAEAPVSVMPAEASAVRDQPLVRVRIRKGVGSAELDRAGPWVVSSAGARVGEVVSGPVRVLVSDGGVKLMGRDGRVTGFPQGVAVFAAPYTAADGSGTVRVDGDTFPGTLRIVPNVGERTFDVINVVDIEAYLPGVVSKELLPGWHESAFRVQAVAARTFALGRREQARRTGRHFDVESTTTDQVYGGTTGMDVAHRAVEATRGFVLVDGARLGTAYYSSTCGGRPALAEEVWPTRSARVEQAAARPAGAVIDPPTGGAAGAAGREILCQDAPLYRWSAVRRVDRLASRIAAWGEANGRGSLASLRGLRDVTPVEFAASGRPVAFRLTDERGVTAELTAEELRIACGFEARGLPTVDPKSRVYSNDLSFRVGSRVVQIEGRGFGHGVGMCQFCAQGMAKRGDDWRRILEVFYPDADIRRVY